MKHPMPHPKSDRTAVIQQKEKKTPLSQQDEKQMDCGGGAQCWHTRISKYNVKLFIIIGALCSFGSGCDNVAVDVRC